MVKVLSSNHLDGDTKYYSHGCDGIAWDSLDPYEMTEREERVSIRFNKRPVKIVEDFTEPPPPIHTRKFKFGKKAKLSKRNRLVRVK